MHRLHRRPARGLRRQLSPKSRLPPKSTGRRRIGLFGGSFNPAHDGHRHVSLTALKALGLDEVWWLVSPQNPLKPEVGMAPFVERLAQAKEIARHPRLRVTDIEHRLGTRYTADTLDALVARYPRYQFVWIMGADNLLDIARWHRWADIFGSVPVAIFDRWPYARYARTSKPAIRFARHQLPTGAERRLVGSKPPAWVFLHCRLHPASATELRAAHAAAPETRGIATIALDSNARKPPVQPAAPEAESIRRAIEAALEDAKAVDIVTINLSGKTTIADYMVIASGRSNRQVGSAAERVVDALKSIGAPASSLEGMENCDWVLIDARDVIVHLFRPEIRELYNLEKMWSMAAMAESEAGDAP